MITRWSFMPVPGTKVKAGTDTEKPRSLVYLPAKLVPAADQSSLNGVLPSVGAGLVMSSMNTPLPPQPSVITSEVFHSAASGELLSQFLVHTVLTLGELASP